MIEPIQQYEKVYALRRSIPVEWVRDNERLALAAFLEWEMVVDNLSCYQARKKYVAQYPESNRQAVGRTIATWFGYKTEDKDYAKGSVLEMIKPYDLTERSLEHIEYEGD